MSALPQEIIRQKRDGHALAREDIAAFVQGVADGSWSDGQVGAMAMACFLRGLTDRETSDLTHAMTRSGDVLDWKGRFDGPILDKHSTGGVGDKVSLPLAAIVAACGGFVPMVSGRGLGHTGGTLDKLEAIPGYRIFIDEAGFEKVLRAAGCSIVGASAQVAPADRRLYALRDTTGTVESVPLICASILSKKAAAGLEALLLDVKAGNGAFAPDVAAAWKLAESLVRVSAGAGLPARAWITDMNQVLGRTAGNAVETAEAARMLRGEAVDTRFDEVTRALSAELIAMGGLAADAAAARARVDAVLASGEAAERFSRMVAAQGGPADFLDRYEHYLPVAPVRREVRAAAAGWVEQVATRDIGLAVIALGGGRRRDSDKVDPRVGFTDVAALGQRIAHGDVLATVHAATEAAAEAASAAIAGAIRVGRAQPVPNPVLIAHVGAEAVR